MPYELILKNRRAPGLPAEVRVAPGRFTLGRGSENNLVVNLPGVSRLHAVIVRDDAGARLSDAGSQNGTFVNGQPVTDAVPLQAGDLLSLGEACEWQVHWRIMNSTARPNSSVLAATAAALIVFAAFIVILLVGRKPHSVEEPAPTPELMAAAMTTPVVPAVLGAQPCAGLTPAIVKNGVQRVALRICPQDAKPYAGLDEQVLAQIQAEVAHWCASPMLERQLARLQQESAALHKLTQGGLLDIDLLAYAALTQTVERGGDPLAQAREMAPTLIQLQIKLGNATAEATLLAVAAYGWGPGPAGSHPLTARMHAAGLDPQTGRNVWETCRRNILRPADCQFITRFLAVGAIAQNPRQFGLNAPPLLF